MRLTYRTWGGDQSERAVDPFGIVNLGRRWYLAGFCHLRSDERVFRIDRITSAVPIDERFTSSPSAEPMDLVVKAVSSIPGTHEVMVVLGTSMSTATRVISPTFGRLEAVEGGVAFRCQTDDLDHIARYLIGFGWPLTIRAPVELRLAFGRRQGSCCYWPRCPPRRRILAHLPGWSRCHDRGGRDRLRNRGRHPRLLNAPPLPRYGVALADRVTPSRTISNT